MSARRTSLVCDSRSTIPCEGGWVFGTLVLRVDGLYSVLDWWTFYPAGFLEWLLVFNYSQESNDRSAMHLDLLRRTRATVGFRESLILNQKILSTFLKGPTRGVLDPDSPWKNRPYPENFSIFPIPNFRPLHPIEYFCSRMRALFKTEMILKNCTRIW